jgi:hypothetical protein
MPGAGSVGHLVLTDLKVGLAEDGSESQNINIQQKGLLMHANPHSARLDVELCSDKKIERSVLKESHYP